MNMQPYVRHKWIKHDSMGRSKHCDRCGIQVDRFGIGRTSYYVWSFADGRMGDTYTNPVPPCTGYPELSSTVPDIPTNEKG